MRLRLCFRVAAMLCALCAVPAIAQSSYPPGEALIGDPFSVFRISSANATASVVDVSGPGFTRAWRIETRVDSSPSWSIEMRAPVSRAVARGDVGLLRFVARAVATTDESG